MSICTLCQKPFTTADSSLEQRLVADIEFCNICFTEFMIERGDSNSFFQLLGDDGKTTAGH
jgi:hypothetical protein